MIADRPDPAAADADARQRLTTDLDTCLFVEAGAGTGKTTAMVARITELVATGRVTAESLIAITFTEAAAGELRARVRDALEAAAVDSARSTVQSQRCAAAAEQLDLAMLSTIHAFAGELLRLFPLEAGCPPRLTVMDPTAELVTRRESFRQWFESAPERPWGPAVGRVLSLGMRVDHLEDLANALAQEWDVITQHTCWTSVKAPHVGEIVGRLGSTIRQLGDGSGLPDHGFARALQRAQLLCQRCASATDDDSCIAALRLAEGIPTVEGSIPSFVEAGGDKGLSARIKPNLYAVREEAAVALAALRTNALCDLLPHLREWVLTDVAGRRRNGTPTFQDLLAWARDLLINDDVRRQCRSRWSHVIVDEFQDTDPLQAELAVLLAAVPEHDPKATAWTDARLIPGRLCVVGDPKQSIYRFRRADIALYSHVRHLMVHDGGAVLTLSRNFRSVPQILETVNRHFARTMVASVGVQPEYVPLHADVRDAGDAVWVMGEPVDAPAGVAWGLEAEAVAAAAATVHRDKWLVRAADAAAPRPATYGDICVLVPTRTNVRRLEQAFEERGVPYRLESGALILQTQEVRELLSTLRAIDDPTDQVALVASLRSPAFGCTDVELHRWVATGGHLDALHPGQGQVLRVREALADVRARHVTRHEHTVAAIVERFIADRMVDVTAYDDRRPREVLRRLRWVASQARAIAASGLGTLRETVDLLESLEQEAPRSSSGAATETDEDSVRVLTVHGAKGLEFPIVILTGLGSDPNLRTGKILVDRLHSRAEARVAVENKPTRWFTTQGYANFRVEEGTHSEAEYQRLLYVAATRARDHLVISVFRSETKGKHARDWAATLTPAGDDNALARRLLVEDAGPTAGEPAAAPSRSVADEIAEESHWIAQRARLIAERSTEVIRSASSIAHEQDAAELDAPDVTAFRRGRGGTAVGRAVHAVLQFVPLNDETSIDDLARVQAAVEGIPERVERIAQLARAAWASEPMRRAAASGRCWREVPVGAMVDGELVEGFIDLLYEEGDDLVVADYKTDDVTGAELEQRMLAYRIQGDVYARLVAATTSRRVSRCEFIFAATGTVQVVSVNAATLGSNGHAQGGG